MSTTPAMPAAAHGDNYSGDEDSQGIGMDNLSLDPSAPQAISVQEMQRLRSVSLLKVHKNIWVQGAIWGWAQKIAKVEGQYLKLYSKPEDVELSATFLSIDVADNECVLVAPTKYGRDFCFECIISNPR